MTTLKLISFGYLHLDGGPSLEASRTKDVRDRLSNPAAARDILGPDGRHPRGQRVVLGTAGVPELTDNLVRYKMPPCGPTHHRDQVRWQQAPSH
ncbi:hypothetical protein [Nonomuraea sp. NEAU-A123]|uniref:hypothetical protein n=1 Tax=Nonomuraea sp. NEAU-A123 TaxID=2839649 RepID=UPI001BE4BD96|nr:hypothetical protein [Nonomuraea sp. NEAU-A123]MBT2232532.1 hypothetical protein [Nonomuraea sp. NEAU-A123]